MKYYKNNREFFSATFLPSVEKKESLNAFNTYTQDRFSAYAISMGAVEEGELTKPEEKCFEKIKSQIEDLKKKYPDIKGERLEFDLAIIFHSNLKNIHWGRYMLDEYNTWRWLSMNYFKDEAFWRRREDFKKRKMYLESAKATFTHCVGERSRDIFPRRYFIIGERLFDVEKKYQLMEKLAALSRESRTGGFGNLISNLVDTKLISPKDYISKSISELLFTEGKLADDKEVLRAFVRYNSFKKRLLNAANKDVLRKEICAI